MNNLKIAAALRALADAFETPSEPVPEQPASPEPQKRSRGRPVKGEDQAPAPTAQAQATSSINPTPATVEVDPFAPTPVETVPTATLEQVRDALTALKIASTQEIALGVLKSVGVASNITELKLENYGAVVKAANAKALEYAKAPEPKAEVDPFEVQATQPVVEAKPLTIEDVKSAVTTAIKRTAQDIVQKVVMEHGGKATNPETGAPAPSLKALPADKYAAVIKAIAELPTTK